MVDSQSGVHTICPQHGYVGRLILHIVLNLKLGVRSAQGCACPPCFSPFVFLSSPYSSTCIYTCLPLRSVDRLLLVPRITIRSQYQVLLFVAPGPPLTIRFWLDIYYPVPSAHLRPGLNGLINSWQYRMSLSRYFISVNSQNDIDRENLEEISCGSYLT